MPVNKREIVFATNNSHKLEEVRRIAGHNFNILSLADIGCHDDIPETAPTLEGNSLLKARWVKDRYGKDCFADDTGLMVDALDGAPGVYSARYAGPGCTPADNVALLLRQMEGKTDRKASFRTVITLITGPGGDEQVQQVCGEVKGTIARTCDGTGGFGYDPVFVPDETGITFASMSADAKNAISHRGRAVAKLFDILRAQTQ